jgi:hypothetical protein
MIGIERVFANLHYHPAAKLVALTQNIPGTTTHDFHKFFDAVKTEPFVWTDGWSGYAAARQRSYDAARSQEPQSVVMNLAIGMALCRGR